MCNLRWCLKERCPGLVEYSFDYIKKNRKVKFCFLSKAVLSVHHS